MPMFHLLSIWIRKLPYVQNNKKMIRGTISSFGVTIAGVLSALGLQLTLSRVLGVDQFGIYTYVISWVSLLGLLACLGLNTAALRFIPGYLSTGKTQLSKGFLIRSHQFVLAASIIIAIILVLIILFLRDHIDHQLFRVFLIGALVIPATAMLLLDLSLVQALKKVIPSQFPRVVFYPLFLSGAILLIDRIYQDPLNGFHAMALDAFAASLTVGFALYLLRTFLPPTVTSATPLFATRNWLRTSIPMLVNSELTIALKRIDIILVGAIIGTTEAGIYAIASKIAQLVSFGLKSSNVMAAPLFAGYHTRGDQQSMQSTASIAAGFASVWCILVGGGLIVFKNLTMQLFGDQFVAGTSVLVILCVGKIGAAITGPVGVILDATGNQDINVKITVVIILCNIFLSAPAIYFIGINGAAMVTATLIVFKNYWCWWEVRRQLGVNTSIFSFRQNSQI